MTILWKALSDCCAAGSISPLQNATPWPPAHGAVSSDYTMNQTALAIEQVFSPVSSIPENDGAGQVSKDVSTLPDHELRV